MNEPNNHTPTAQWQMAIEAYNRVLAENARYRIAAMSNIDRQRYAQAKNTASDSSDDILTHMSHWDGFHKLVMSGALVKNESCLFRRLLDGKAPLEYPPPRRFGKPWYELFDHPEAVFECCVSLIGESRRERDAGKKATLLCIDDGTWECFSASSSGSQLLVYQAQWQGLSPAAREPLVDEILEVFARLDASFKLRYGHWSFHFDLIEKQTIPSDELTNIIFDKSDFINESNVLGFAQSVKHFPFVWVLSRSS